VCLIVGDHLPVIERVIRVHVKDLPTFILVTRNGIVAEVSLDSERWTLDKDEALVAAFYRKHGATFVDMLAERGTVQPTKRGQRAGKAKAAAIAAKAPARRAASATLESMKNYDPNAKVDSVPF
jgi:hypothetical protein